jgi:hypothetical protein|tara:strand:- start:695 stop:979 length:285 start_codon:yes stop_codon:yes gene_type:complete
METTELISLIETLGFPVFMAIVLIGGIYFMMKWMMNTLMSKLNSLWEMVVKLIDRIRALDNSIIRLETMIRILKDIDPDWERIGKLDNEDKRTD